MIAESPSVNPNSVTEIVSIGTGRARNELFGASDGTGTICIAERAVGSSPFQCLNSRYDPYAVIVFPVIGGSSMSAVDQASLVGIARADVARLTVSLLDGSDVDLSLDKWRSFSYIAAGASSVPQTLRAFDSRGNLLQTLGLATPPPLP
jgi:hypothetical protein